jgi:hypothetical protein
VLQRAAPWFGLPASFHESSGELPPKRRVGDGDDQGVLCGELFQPGRCAVDAGRLCRGWVLPAESQEQSSPPDCDGPRRERETKPAENGAFEIELAQQRRDNDLVPRSQQARRGDGTGSVAGEHEVGTLHQLMKRGRNARVFVDTCGLIGLPPCPEAIGGDPAGVDVRGAGMTHKGDATVCLHGVLHATEGTSDACANGAICYALGALDCD